MRGASFWLLTGSSQWPATTHGAAALGVVAAARALDEEDGGGWADARILAREAGGLEWLKRRRN
jgi:hypothetical protein